MAGRPHLAGRQPRRQTPPGTSPNGPTAETQDAPVQEANRRKDRPRSAIAAGGDEVEFVEVKGRTVDVAVEAALAELGLASADKAEIEVLQQPERGFLGLGGREAIVRVRAKKEDASARKRRSRKPQRQQRQPQGKRVEQTNRADREAADQPFGSSGRNSSAVQTGRRAQFRVRTEATPQNSPSKSRPRWSRSSSPAVALTASMGT